MSAKKIPTIDDSVELFVNEFVTKRTNKIKEMAQQIAVLKHKINQDVSLFYQELRGAHKATLVWKIFEIEVKVNGPFGANKRVADIVGISPARVTQLISSLSRP